MSSILRFLGVFLTLGLALPALAQEKTSPKPASKPAQNRPQFRPAVLGSGPDSLVNRIDAEALVKKGQKDGAVMFCAAVGPTGEARSAWTYRPMPNTDALVEEVKARLAEVTFTPAIYQYQPVGVLLFGTVVFSATKTPHLQIFLNQDPVELKAASDFIAPQPVIGGDSSFDGLTLPEGGTPIQLTAVVDLGLKVNRKGEMEGIRVLAEEPPLLGFGEAALSDFRGAKFIPAFRLGDPDDCDVVQPICYHPAE